MGSGAERKAARLDMYSGGPHISGALIHPIVIDEATRDQASGLQLPSYSVVDCTSENHQVQGSARGSQRHQFLEHFM